MRPLSVVRDDRQVGPRRHSKTLQHGRSIPSLKADVTNDLVCQDFMSPDYPVKYPSGRYVLQHFNRGILRLRVRRMASLYADFRFSVLRPRPFQHLLFVLRSTCEDIVSGASLSDLDEGEMRQAQEHMASLGSFVEALAHQARVGPTHVDTLEGREGDALLCCLMAISHAAPHIPANLHQWEKGRERDGHSSTWASPPALGQTRCPHSPA